MRAPTGIQLLLDGVWDLGSSGGSWSPAGCGCRRSCGCEQRSTRTEAERPQLADHDGNIWASTPVSDVRPSRNQSAIPSGSSAVTLNELWALAIDHVEHARESASSAAVTDTNAAYLYKVGTIANLMLMQHRVTAVVGQHDMGRLLELLNAHNLTDLNALAEGIRRSVLRTEGVFFPCDDPILGGCLPTWDCFQTFLDADWGSVYWGDCDLGWSAKGPDCICVQHHAPWWSVVAAGVAVFLLPKTPAVLKKALQVLRGLAPATGRAIVGC